MSPEEAEADRIIKSLLAFRERDYKLAVAKSTIDIWFKSQAKSSSSDTDSPSGGTARD